MSRRGRSRPFSDWWCSIRGTVSLTRDVRRPPLPAFKVRLLCLRVRFRGPLHSSLSHFCGAKLVAHQIWVSVSVRVCACACMRVFCGFVTRPLIQWLITP